MIISILLVYKKLEYCKNEGAQVCKSLAIIDFVGGI